MTFQYTFQTNECYLFLELKCFLNPSFFLFTPTNRVSVTSAGLTRSRHGVLMAVAAARQSAQRQRNQDGVASCCSVGNKFLTGRQT